MNKYIYSECPSDYWPSIKNISAPSYQEAVEKLIQKFGENFDDDEIFTFNTIEQLQEYLNSEFNFVLSDLTDIEEL